MSPEKLQVPLPHKTDFNADDNPVTNSEFFKICEDYGVPNNPMNTGMKNFIGLISVVLPGLMITLVQIQ